MQLIHAAHSTNTSPAHLMRNIALSDKDFEFLSFVPSSEVYANMQFLSYNSFKSRGIVVFMYCL